MNYLSLLNLIIYYFFRLEARDAKGTKKSKVTRDRERDISEKIALGMANVQTGKTGEAMYDSRLFNQDRGMTTGHLSIVLKSMFICVYRIWS